MSSLLPPAARSTAALRLTVAAIEGRFLLPTCPQCGHMSYPPNETCADCLHDQLDWREAKTQGEILAITNVERPIEPYFRACPPLPLALVRLDSGLTLFAFLVPGADLRREVKADVVLRLNAAGTAVVLAGLTDRSVPLPGLSSHSGASCMLDSPDPSATADRLTAAFASQGIAHRAQPERGRHLIEAQIGDRTFSINIRTEPIFS
jgi:uncharacterized OB-fold protein